MLNKNKILALLLAAVMLLGTLTGCGETGTVETTDGGTSAATTTAATTAPEEQLPAQFDLAIDGESAYSVIRDEDVSTGSTEVVLARNILNLFKTQVGATVSLGTDWVKRGAELDLEAPEILIGMTDYPETQQVVSELKYGEYAVRAVGNKIVVFGYDAAGLSEAASSLMLLMKKYTSEDGKSISIPTEELDIKGSSNEQLSALPAYEGGVFYSYYAAGMNCDEIIINDTNLEQYNAYLGKLEANGFTCYTTNEMAGNHFATYTNDKYTVTAGYYDYETAARLLIEPLAPAVGLKSDNVYTPVTTSQITMLGVAYEKSDGSYANNGLSVLIRCADGSFIVVDGGFNHSSSAKTLLDTIREQSAAYAKSDKDITIAAWILTHAHGDHNGMFNNYATLFRNMNVERVLLNALSETERQSSINGQYKNNWSASEGRYEASIKVAETLGAELHQVHVGQVYYFGDVEMEILYTIESFAPNTCNALNTSSIVTRMKFSDGTTYMSTGDATGYGMEICSDMFGNYIQSDIVQVCHHGYSTWGDDAGMIEAYKTINAPTVLWPQGSGAYPSYKTKVYNKVVFEVPNFKEVYVSGEAGDKIIVPIPYSVGATQEIRAN